MMATPELSLPAHAAWARAELAGRELVALALLLAGVAVAAALAGTALDLTLPLVVLGLCAWGLLVFGYAFRVPHYAIVAVLTVTIFQDIFIGLLASRSPSRAGVLLLVAFTTALPAVFAAWFGLLRVGMRVERRGLALHVVAAAYMAVVLVGAIAGGQSLRAMLPALRNGVAFLVMFYFAYLLPGLTRATLRRVLVAFGVLVAATVVFGYLERFVLGDYFWVRVLNLDVLSEIKNLTPTAEDTAPVPADFYSPLGGATYRRMASFYATPISLGYLMAFATVYVAARSLGERGVRRGFTLLAAFVLGVTLLLTLVKGAYGIAGLGVMGSAAAMAGVRMGWPFWRTMMVWLLLALPVIVAGILLFAQSTAFLHVYGLWHVLQGLSGIQLLVGHGLGTGGTISARLGADILVSTEQGAESGIGTLLYQFGMVGSLLYMTFFVILLKKLYVLYADRRADWRFRTMVLGVLGGCLGLFVNAFLQENALAPVPIAPYYIFAGALLNLAAARD